MYNQKLLTTASPNPVPGVADILPDEMAQTVVADLPPNTNFIFNLEKSLLPSRQESAKSTVLAQREYLIVHFI